MTSSAAWDILKAVALLEDDDPLPLRLCRAAVAALSITGVGLALMTQDGHAGMVSATDGPARKMEQLQFLLREGPCLDAARSGRPVLEPDLSVVPASTWPGFLSGMADSEVKAIFAFPLNVGVIRIGVLDLYRDTTGVLDGPELAMALAYADAATFLLLHLQDQSSDGLLHPSLREPWEHRAVVHQATGMVAAQAGVRMADAFQLLAARTGADERPLVDVARDVVARRLRLDNAREDEQDDDA
jgi:ANTAR domain